MAIRGGLTGLVWLLAAAVASAGQLGQRVVIVYNEQQPEGRLLAEYYAQKREVPQERICRIRVRPAETITRREFNEQIREPLLRFLTRNRLLVQEPRTIMDPLLGRLPWLETVDSRVDYIVLIYGVPLRIDHDASIVEKLTETPPHEAAKKNWASVESELALLPAVGLPLSGPLRNPFFAARSAFGPPLDRQMLLVGRLDGPDPQIVRRMIDDALTAERYGLHGRAYFDAQGTRDAGYVEGDEWIRGSYRAFREAGFECELDEKTAVFDEEDPVSDVAVYAGWYAQHVSGPFRRDDFRFRCGAIAYHIHSVSAASVRSRSSHWAGPLLARGAAATMGNVFEPFLSMTPHVDKFFQRLLEGAPFLEAGYASQPVLSWQTTFVGDPLYRPFAVPLDEQIARLQSDGRTNDLAWACVRKVNWLLARGEISEAIELCREKAATLAEPVLHEKLGDLLRVAHRHKEAIEAYKMAMHGLKNSHHNLRVATKLAGTYETSGQREMALAVYEALLAARPNKKAAAELCERARDVAVALGQHTKAQQFQARLNELARPAEGK
jgi:uncharacterized protein (TIGR03790 family)